MNQEIKKELLFGLGIIGVIVGILITTIISYNKQTKIVITPPSQIQKQNTSLIISEINKHSKSSDCWLLIENKVYDATNFLKIHPGGADKITPYCGVDATQAFRTKDGQGTHSDKAFKYLSIIYIGNLNGKIIQTPDKNKLQSLPIPNQEND